MRVERGHRRHEQQCSECNGDADDVTTHEAGGPVADGVGAGADRFVPQVTTHVIGQRGDRSVAFAHVLLERLGDDRVEVPAKLATQPRGGRAAMRRRLQPAGDAELGVLLAELARVYQDQRLDDRAEALHREGLAVRRRLLGDRHIETAVSENNLASVLRLRGDLDQAEALLRHSLGVTIATRGPRHPNIATTRHDLALISYARGDYTGAESEMRAALALQRESVGPAHPTVALTLNSLAHVQVARGQHSEALESLRAAIDIIRASFGGTHQLVAIFTLNAAAVHLSLGDHAAATPLLVEGLRLRALAPDVVPSRRRTLPEDDWSLDAARRALASAAPLLATH